MSVKYHVALSFAGEDRGYVEQVANHLRRAGVEVFYDKYEQVDLWGKDLYEHLSDVYKSKALYTVMFISEHYAQKLWARHERRAAQTRAFSESSEYILPTRFDDTEVPGLNETVGYLDLRTIGPDELAAAVEEKLVLSGIALWPAPKRPSGTMGPGGDPVRTTISVHDQVGRPVVNVDVMLVASNGTYLRAKTSDTGHAEFEVKKRQLYDVFCAHRSFPAYHAREFDPANDLAVKFHPIEDTGSLISLGGWDSIPGLSGSMNSIHDSSNRLYVYTKNIAVDGGKLQPATFSIGNPMHFEDSSGSERFVTFIAVIANCFLVEFSLVGANA
ncbi:TIR domain-containing protein [Nodosilinea sp. LEGE 07088]|uniref:toll/interleukin-1 receptor domain-containing protein n=1 Tax=Nodosilinea sp. LEGE 07088 TaxID=2777968 RepID=UPI0028BF0E90|nr:TIR domain-containing protein [Nodosilinea sp. LEGE 07088]